MRQPIQTIPLEDLRDWLLKHSKAERQNGEIAFANHTMRLRESITRAAQKQNQSAALAESGRNAMENAA